MLYVGRVEAIGTGLPDLASRAPFELGPNGNGQLDQAPGLVVQRPGLVAGVSKTFVLTPYLGVLLGKLLERGRDTTNYVR